MLGVTAFTLISSIFNYSLIKSIASGEPYTLTEASANDLREAIVYFFQGVLYILCGIFFIMWFRRAYYNLHQKVSYLSFSEGWAAGAWFVPFINLWRPFRIMKELYQETPPLLKKNNFDFEEPSLTYPAIWWTLYILSAFFGAFIWSYSRNAFTLDQFTTVALMQVIANTIEIPLILVTIKVIKDYAKIEPLLHEIKEEVEQPPIAEIATEG